VLPLPNALRVVHQARSETLTGEHGIQLVYLVVQGSPATPVDQVVAALKAHLERRGFAMRAVGPPDWAVWQGVGQPGVKVGFLAAGTLEALIANGESDIQEIRNDLKAVTQSPTCCAVLAVNGV
jgi:hypothetical protein